MRVVGSPHEPLRGPIDTAKGPRAHPAVVEARQQRITLARLLRTTPCTCPPTCSTATAGHNAGPVYAALLAGVMKRREPSPNALPAGLRRYAPDWWLLPDEDPTAPARGALLRVAALATACATRTTL
ncbi:MAG: hypothetical protein WBA97_20745 [Actinophytocola sp.]|uniref:hypothetical protein n=1 Tax=Actinophytocola sp. TaxID=1872138 RepID=UPI003C771E85